MFPIVSCQLGKFFHTIWHYYILFKIYFHKQHGYERQNAVIEAVEYKWGSLIWFEIRELVSAFHTSISQGNY